ncbi:DNA primase/polymerase-like protein [Microbacterium sp. HM58-2]|nr:DNA primase/polymerase-like protein [Microbacterium sp. HM58-2]
MVAHGAVTSLLIQTDQRALSLAATARELARAGIPVFPVAPGEKRPLAFRGFLDATTDLRIVERWWRRHPSANLAIPTGAASGVVVVDVDVRHVDGRSAFRRAQANGLASGWLLLVTTPSGGTHAYFPATPGLAQPCWQAPRAGIDFRGDGGYILVPPSSLLKDAEPRRYQVTSLGSGPAATIDASRLRDALDPRPVPRARAVAAVRSADAERLATWVARRTEGERNHGLFWAACRLAESGLPLEAATDALITAATAAGLAEREIMTTIRSAYRTAGAQAHPSADAPATPTQEGKSPRAVLSDATIRGLP